MVPSIVHTLISILSRFGSQFYKYHLLYCKRVGRQSIRHPLNSDISCVVCPVSCFVCTMSCVECHVLCVLCHVLCVQCQVLCVPCHVFCDMCLLCPDFLYTHCTVIPSYRTLCVRRSHTVRTIHCRC